MSNISVLRSDFESTSWKRAFADMLLQLRPDMNPDAADEVSDAAFLTSKDVQPEVAARRWLDGDLPECIKGATAING